VSIERPNAEIVHSTRSCGDQLQAVISRLAVGWRDQSPWPMRGKVRICHRIRVVLVGRCDFRVVARPGGNLTGLFLDAPGLCSKLLLQMREVVPGVKKIAVMWDTTTGRYQLDGIDAAAKMVSVDVQVTEYRDSEGMVRALDLGLNEASQAVIQLGSPLIRQGAPAVAQIMSARRLPAISVFRTFPDAGGLMSYGPDLNHLFRRLGSFVSRILRGAHPGELPIERPTKFELVINLKAAKALGLEMPATLLGSADEVIE
jgi:putative tryptophan/tyrosine transport system substrate-binding protein